MKVKKEYNLNKNYSIEKNGDNATIFDLYNSYLYTFNPLGTLILDLIKNEYSKNQILEEIIQKYDVTRIRATEDFENFITELKKKNILQ